MMKPKIAARTKKPAIAITGQVGNVLFIAAVAIAMNSATRNPIARQAVMMLQTFTIRRAD